MAKTINPSVPETVIISPIPLLSEQDSPKMVNTIGETARYCRMMNIGVSESTIRFLCKSGAIPCIRVGSKILLNWEIFMDYLKSGGSRSAPPVQQPTAGIHAIPEKLKV